MSSQEEIIKKKKFSTMSCKIRLGIIWLLLECEPLKMAFVHLHQGPRVETMSSHGLSESLLFGITSVVRIGHPTLVWRI